MRNIYFLFSFSLLFSFSNSFSQNVGIGVPIPQEKLHIDGFLRGNQSGAVRVSTGNGYVDIGPKNGSWSHFETDRARFYFNKAITVDGGLIGSHTGQNLSLQTNGTTRVTVLNSNGNVGLGGTPTSKLEVFNGSLRLPSSTYEGAGQIQSADIVRFANGSSAQGVYVKQISASSSWGDNDSYTQTNGIYSSGNLRVGGSSLALFANTSNGNVGIGTTANASYKLYVNGNTNINGSLILQNGVSINEFSTDVTLGGNSNTAVATERAVKTYVDNQISGSDDWTKTGNDIYNNNSGNVGIGVAPSSFKLDVNGDLRARNRVYIGTSGANFYNDAGSRVKIDQDFYTDNANTYLYGDNTYLGSSSGDNILLRGNQFSWTSGGGGVINASGNVAIGHTSPSEKLDIDGQIRIRGGSPAAGKVLISDANGVATWGKEGMGEHNSGTVTAGNWYRIASNTGNRANAEFTLRDFISGGGHSTMKFQVGASYGNDGGMSFTMLSHSIYSTPTFTQVRILRLSTYDDMYLEVYCARSGNVDYSIVNNLQSSGWVPVDWTAGAIPSGYTARAYDGNNIFAVGDYQNRFTVYRGGDALLAGRFRSNGINETSDARFKKDITELESSLENVLQMRGVKYYWKVDEFPNKGFSNAKEIGVIAQEIEAIYPELVNTDAEGYKSVQYSHLVPVLIEAIKEQQAIIQKQKTQMDEMSAEICVQNAKTENQETRLQYLEEMLLQQSKN